MKRFIIVLLTVTKLITCVTFQSSAQGSEFDGAPNLDVILDFSKESNVKTYMGGNNSVTGTYNTDGYLTYKVPKADDPYSFIDVSKSGSDMMIDDYPVIRMKIRISEGSPLSGQLFFANETTGISEAASFPLSYKDTTDWQYITIDMSKNAKAEGALQALRWDMFRSSDGDFTADIAYIAFFQTIEDANAFDDNYDKYGDNPGGGDSNLGEPGEKLSWKIDGTESLRDYANNGGWGFISRKNIVVNDETLTCALNKSFSLYSKRLPGDDYGLNDVEISFDASVASGSLKLGLRLVKPEDETGTSGFWVEFMPDGSLKLSEANGWSAVFNAGINIIAETNIRIYDKHDKITFTVDGIPLFMLNYNLKGNTFTVTDKDGNLIGEEGTQECLPANGYFKLTANNLNGYIDNISYSHENIVGTIYDQKYATDYSTWKATDDLGRTTPMNSETGYAKEKYVGIFYFMIHSDDMGGRIVDDTTECYLNKGLDGLKAMLSAKANKSGIYWAEPYFGYYNSTDKWVFRKHAEMLSAAGVDFIFIDNSNCYFYKERTQCLLDTWKEIRNAGGNTPQVCFMFGDMPATTVYGLCKLKDDILDNEKYSDLLFKWEGKPLILGNNDIPTSGPWTVSATTPQSKKQFTTAVEADEEVKEFYNSGAYAAAQEKYTIRKCWAWQANTNKGYWDWLQESPQAQGTNLAGDFEQMSVTMGVHAHTGRGRSYVNAKDGYDKGADFGFSLGTARYGLMFAEQFEYAIKQDPDVIMITGWNEWYAGVIKSSQKNQMTGATLTPYYYLVDQFTPEYSRDGEPMKIRDGEGSVGFGDNYYYQMVSYIRRYKGINAMPAMVNGNISLDAADIDAQWADVNPMFTDNVNDTALRSEYSFAAKYLYLNASGRNDIEIAKIAQDDANVYFYVTTANELITVDDENWMNLFIDTDNNFATGWEGYDYVINRSRADGKMKVEKFVGNSWETAEAGDAEYVTGKNSITVKVAKSILGYNDTENASFGFKWADNCDVDGDVMFFMELGDAAPDSRFMFVYDPNEKQPDITTDTDTTDTETADVTKEETTEPIVTDTEPITTVDISDNTSAADTTTSGESDTTETKAEGCGSVFGGAIVMLLLIPGAYIFSKQKRSLTD